MKILLNGASKRYMRQWIFKDINYQFEQGEHYALLGKNGSGKSTLLQCIVGAVMLSKGQIEYTVQQQPLEPAQAYLHIALATPYLELIEEFTALEMLHFHAQFKPFYAQQTEETILNAVGLWVARNKQIQHYSSGMKQRLKLALAFYTQSSLLCLDEPTANLDADGIAIYQHLVQSQLNDRTVIVASNDPQEYAFCPHHIHISDYQ